MSQVPAWTELSVLVPCGWEELVAEVLGAAPATGAAFGPPSIASAPLPPGCELVRAYVSEHEDVPALRARLAQRLRELASASGAAELAQLELRFRRLPPEDYEHSWEKVWRAFRVGRLCVHRPAHPCALRPGERELLLEPGSVFGTGRHATTRMCLAALQQRVRPGQRVLDAGCGTGILAVASALFGAGHALGFDLDPQAAPSARALAHDNGVGHRCEFRRGDFDVLAPRERFDGLLANLYSDLLQSHATQLAAWLEPRGWFAISGCSAENAAATRAALESAGLAIEDERQRGRWSCFLGTRR